MLRRRPGRPRTIPQVERRMGVRLEHYVMEQMTNGRTSRQIAKALGCHVETLRRHLRERGYRVVQDSRLEVIDSPDQGDSGRHARGTIPAEKGQEVSAPGPGDSPGRARSGRPRRSRGR